MLKAGLKHPSGQLSSEVFESEPKVKGLEKGYKSTLNPLPMQYLGAKSRISEWIIESILLEFPKSKKFFDLFAGTGSVALAAAYRGYSITANDLQPYSYAVLKSLFVLPKKDFSQIIASLEKLKTNDQLLEGRKYLSSHLKEEDAFIKQLKANSFDWKQYKNFCDETPIVKSISEVKKLKKKLGWCLFSKYYANNYFGIRQSLEIDAVRQYADTLESTAKENVLAAVISVLTFAVSSTTHLAQFLKPNSKKQAEFLLKKRTINIIDGVIDRLQRLPHIQRFTEGTAYNLDYIEALNITNLDEGTVVYADPPYFKEHYSRYYHVLDTFYLYDYPELTINERTVEVTAGRYRSNRNVSNFGLKSKVVEAFREMLLICLKKKCKLAISYADTSLIPVEQMAKLIEECGYKIKLKKIPLMHSAQGQPRNKVATEYLYLLES